MRCVCLLSVAPTHLLLRPRSGALRPLVLLGGRARFRPYGGLTTPPKHAIVVVVVFPAEAVELALKTHSFKRGRSRRDTFGGLAFLVQSSPCEPLLLPARRAA